MNEQQNLYLPNEGEKVGSGIVLSRISSGGTACVYKTWVESLEMHRAVKVMLPEAEPGTRERFSTEARITSKLTHLNIVQVHGCGETASGLPYIEMEFVNGYTLEAVLKQRGALPLSAALAVAAGVLDALHYAHNTSYTLYGQQHSGAMHRDIKPGNIIFSGGIPKLMDFGIARPVEVSMHTMMGTIPGTVPYMAPEMCGGGVCDFRSDVYQIGLLLYECISGRPPYPQPDFMSLVTAISAGERRPLDTHPKAAAIVKKCTELDPNKRYQSAYKCLEDVRSLYNAINPHTTPEECILASFRGAEESSNGAKAKRAKHKSDDKKTSKTAAAAMICFLLLFGLGVGLFLYNPAFQQLLVKQFDPPGVSSVRNNEPMFHWLSVPEPQSEPVSTPESESESDIEADSEQAPESGVEPE